MEIRTLFISDVHLGSNKSQAGKLLEVLKNYNIYTFAMKRSKVKKKTLLSDLKH